MEVEAQVQKHLVTFCKYLPTHVDLWRSSLQDSVKPLQNLSHFYEQRRHVQAADLSLFPDIGDRVSLVLAQISERMEEDFTAIKGVIDRLSKSNFDLKNKLLVFERSTLDLDWEEDSEIIRGSGSQPSLSRLLECALEFSNFFFRSGKQIGEHFRNLDVDNEKTFNELRKSFDVDLDDRAVARLVALTQYVDNAKAII